MTSEVAKVSWVVDLLQLESENLYFAETSSQTEISQEKEKPEQDAKVLEISDSRVEPSRPAIAPPSTSGGKKALNFPKNEEIVFVQKDSNVRQQPTDAAANRAVPSMPLLVSLIALSSLLCILMAILIYQNCRSRAKPFNVAEKFVESLANSGKEELQ